jgi:hypothetical protein
VKSGIHFGTEGIMGKKVIIFKFIVVQNFLIVLFNNLLSINYHIYTTNFLRVIVRKLEYNYY